MTRPMLFAMGVPIGVVMGVPSLDPYGYRIADTEKEQTPLYTNRAGGNLRQREANAEQHV